MRNFCFFTFFTLALTINCQTKTFNIDWDGHASIGYSNKTWNLPFFQSANYEFNPEQGLSFIGEWNFGIKNSQELEITDISYKTISEAELKDLPKKLIPRKINLRAYPVTYRNKIATAISINPIIFENSQYKRVMSFTVTYVNSSGFSDRYTSVNQQIVSNSVLASGNWYRFAVDTTGIFKLSRSFIQNLGVEVSSVNPKNIKIYGHGGKSLPLLNSQTPSYDLIENAIHFQGEEDGVFDNNDYILFYATGSEGFNTDNNSHINPYSDEVYYYLNISNMPGKRVAAAVEPTGVVTTQFNSYHNYQFHEIDEINAAKLGRRWLGESFYVENNRDFIFNFPNRVDDALFLKVYTAAIAESNTSMQLRLNSQSLSTFNYSAIDEPILASEGIFQGAVSESSDQLTVRLLYNSNGNPSARAYLDYISIEAECFLTYSGSQFSFSNKEAVSQFGIGQYNLSNASTITEIWNVTDPYNPTAFTNDNGADVFNFKIDLGAESKFQVIDPNDYFEPIKLGNSSLPNQNIKGTVFVNSQGQFEDVDYLIITRADLLPQAERLAQINRAQNNLNVKVYSLESIYNEFSSGMQDIAAIRNFVKYVYDNASTPEKRIKYLCLFGDGSFDYKDTIVNNTNVVPSWHALSSFNLTNSFVSDDFFGMMGDNEGTMANSDKLDIAVGRILADGTKQAKEMVDKVEAYYDESSYGNWRNNVMVISDDVDVYSDRTIQETSNLIADNISSEKPIMNILKIHSDAYLQEVTAGGVRYPEVNKAIFDAVEVGALVVNYFGHGGEDGLARERIFDIINAQNINNPNKLNCFVTVTCEYTKFDNPLRPTAGEYLFWNPKGGAIGLITTTRQIFINVGVNFNVTLSQYLFSYDSTAPVSMAEALRQTKNDPLITNSSQRRLVFFIGDPALKLPLPKPNIRVTEINGEPSVGASAVLSALSAAQIKGEVTDAAGNILNSYNGTLTATIYDKNVQRSTLANDGVTNVVTGNLITMDFESLGEVIFRGKASVVNGQFEFNFIVPRDISVPVGNGKVSLYAQSEAPLEDRGGYNFDVLIGGVNLDAAADNKGPDINLFMNDESFVSGGITNESPTLIAKLFDVNGINTASGIGHDIIAILDGDETNPFKLNAYYSADLDDYTNGQLSYPFRDLEPGLHTLSLKAWDVYNNSSTQEIQFVVYDENESLTITNVLNYPNPFVNYTEFWFNHNSSEVLDVVIQVFTVSGKLVKTITGQTNTTNGSLGSLSRDLTWDGRDDYGNKIGKGVYVYKLKVKSSTYNKQTEKIQKLVIL